MGGAKDNSLLVGSDVINLNDTVSDYNEFYMFTKVQGGSLV